MPLRDWLLAPVLEQGRRFHAAEMASLDQVKRQLDRIEAIITPPPAGPATELQINVVAITEQEN